MKKMKLFCNSCDNIHNSVDVHFTSICDNRCKHCIDRLPDCMKIDKPDINKIFRSIYENRDNMNDVLFLGGEPCLYLEELLKITKKIKKYTNLKVYVTTSAPKKCFEQKNIFEELIRTVDGINISVQHYDEEVADKIRGTKSQYDRQKFYASLPMKYKIRININILKPYLQDKQEIIKCLKHYDALGFNSIKLSELQHTPESYVSFEKIFELKMESPYSNGCQTFFDTKKIIDGGLKTPLIIKRSCFVNEPSCKATLMDGVKVFTKLIYTKKNKFLVIYEDGKILKGWR